MSFKDQLVAKTRSGKLTADELSDSNTLSDDIFTDDEPALTGFTKQDEDFDPSDLLETQDIDELEKLAYTEAPAMSHEYGLDIDETPVEPEEPHMPQPVVAAPQPEPQVAQISYGTSVMQEPEPEPYAPPAVTAPVYAPPVVTPEPAPYVAPRPQPEIPHVYEPQHQPQPYVEPHDIEEAPEESKIQSETAALLLDYAKSHIMLDIATSFNSEIFSKEAVTNLINTYNGKSNAQSYSNANALISSLLDEVVESDYKNDHYGDITKNVIAAIKEDLV